MTIQKWNEKVSAILDKVIDKCAQEEKMLAHYNVHEGPYCNGVLFCDSTKEYVRCLFCADSELLTACNDRTKAIAGNLKREFDRDSSSAVSVEHGQYVDRWGKVTKVRKIESSEKGTAYVNEKLLRVFPKNVKFYVTGPYSAVHVMMEDYPNFHYLGLVMPMRCENFEPIEK